MKGFKVMRKFTSVLFSIALVFMMGYIPNLQAQEDDAESNGIMSQSIRVFVDGGRLDMDYIRDEINYVNYVWDRQNADVHVLITQQRAGSGTEYTMAFLGLKEYSDMSDTLVATTNDTQTETERREVYTNELTIGLLPYVARTPVFQELSFNISREMEERGGNGQEEVTDKWNYWVFRIGGNVQLSGEESENSTEYRGNVSAERVTENLKLDFRAFGNYDESQFTFTDRETDEERTFTSLRKGWNASADIIPSISPHWSVGAFLSGRSSSFQNIDRSFEVETGVEYNLFPYAEYARRELRIQYRLGYVHNAYVDTTIYNEISEGLGQTSLRAILSLTQPWGEASATVEASTYLHDFEKKRFEFNANLEIRIVRGLSLDVRGGYDIIHDQLNLPKGDADTGEIITRQRELATSYDYSMSVGLNWTFGSIYNNIVNPRFGGGGGFGGGFR